MKLRWLASAATLYAASTHMALADISIIEAMAKVSSLGYEVIDVETGDTVYEVLARNGDGRLVEVYVSIATGEIVGDDDGLGDDEDGDEDEADDDDSGADEDDDEDDSDEDDDDSGEDEDDDSGDDEGEDDDGENEDESGDDDDGGESEDEGDDD